MPTFFSNDVQSYMCMVTPANQSTPSAHVRHMALRFLLCRSIMLQVLAGLVSVLL